MYRLFTWLTLFGIIAGTHTLITTLDEFNAQVSKYSSGASNTGQTQPAGSAPEPQAPAPVIEQPAVQTQDRNQILDVRVSHPPEKTFEQQCEEKLPASTVTTVLQDVITVHDYTKDSQALTQMSGSKSTTIGLTVSYPNVNIVWNIELLEDKRAGRVCMRPTFYVSANAGVQNVYVGKEFMRSTCAFNEILEHELRHVEANKKIAGLVAESVKKYIAASIENRVVYGKDRKEVEEYVIDAIQHHWIPFAKENFNYYKKFHHEIDSVEEYTRIQYVCKGEIPALLNQQK